MEHIEGITTIPSADKVHKYAWHARAIREIEMEIVRAEAHGEQFASMHEAYGVMFEELDEFWDLTRLKKRDRNPDDIRKELIQLGAMTMKAIGSIENFVGGKV
jgi:hypothetical protein